MANHFPNTQAPEPKSEEVKAILEKVKEAKTN
jgi:hypothetical protein